MKSDDENKPYIALVPAAIAAVLAAIGIAGMAFVFVSADRAVEGSGVGMQSATAVYRAGATITPTAPRAVRPPIPIMAADDGRKDL